MPYAKPTRANAAQKCAPRTPVPASPLAGFLQPRNIMLSFPAFRNPQPPRAPWAR